MNGEQSISENGWNRLHLFVKRAVWFCLMWWVITGGRSDSWIIGVPVVILATLASVALLPHLHWTWRGLLRMIPFFLWQSLRGGIDVAYRAFHPKLPLAPGIFEYSFRLPKGPGRIVMANIVSLLPGTLSAEISDRCLYVHVLGRTLDICRKLNRLEQRVADLFDLRLSGR